MAKKKSKKSGGAGLAKGALVAASAGYYFLYASPGARKNRNKVKAWMLKARGDVVGTLEKQTKHIDKEKYHQSVDQVIARYKKLRDVNNAELAQLQNELKRHWNVISKEATPEKRAVKKVAKKTVKKAKSVAKKVKGKAKKAIKKRKK